MFASGEKEGKTGNPAVPGDSGISSDCKGYFVVNSALTLRVAVMGMRMLLAGKKMD